MRTGSPVALSGARPTEALRNWDRQALMGRIAGMGGRYPDPMSFVFLSSAWIEQARGLRDQMRPGMRALGFDIRMNVTVTDSPLDDAPNQLFLQVDADQATFDLGRLSSADVDITTSYSVARDVLTSGNPELALHEIMIGGIEVEGDFAKLLEFGGTLATDGALLAAEIGRHISSFTS
jgi:hypothetical protein